MRVASKIGNVNVFPVSEYNHRFPSTFIIFNLDTRFILRQFNKIPLFHWTIRMWNQGVKDSLVELVTR